MATTNFVDGTTIVVADWLNDVDAHAYNQQTAAHSAANISFVPTGTIAATDVQTAIAEVATDAATAITNLTATQVAYTPTGSVAATNVQTAIDEVVAETVQKTGDTGSAKMPAGTTAQRDGSPAAGWTRWNSTLSVNETYNGTEWVQEKSQASSVVATTSGTSHSITGVPAYATRVEIHLDAVSTTGTSPMLVQAGSSAGLVVTGYGEAASYDIFLGSFSGAITTGFPVSLNAAATTMRGTVTLFKKPGTNRWECRGLTSRAAGGLVWTTGYIDLPGALDRIALSRSGADSFDAGSVWATWS